MRRAKHEGEASETKALEAKAHETVERERRIERDKPRETKLLKVCREKVALRAGEP